MIDGAVLAGYLAVGASRASGRVFDATANGLFDRLARAVAQRVGRRAVEAVEDAPGDLARQRLLGIEIDAVARQDPYLAAELTQLQRELDRRVGRRFIEAVQAIAHRAAEHRCR
ncbi:MAG TPA: hypothetical protein VGD67_02970 [Pseudonocardiaceae bacterium]